MSNTIPPGATYASVVPLRRVHLEQAIAWARGQKHPAIPEDVRYDQRYWNSLLSRRNTCGTAFCVHGAAHVMARGLEAPGEPQSGDYADCGEYVVILMKQEDSTLDQLEDSLDWEEEDFEQWRHNR